MQMLTGWRMNRPKNVRIGRKPSECHLTVAVEQLAEKLVNSCIILSDKVGLLLVTTAACR